MSNLNNKGFDFLIEPSEYKTIPCQRTCLLHIDISSYMYLVSRGRFDEANEVIRETNPFPSICGRICPHPCERGCTRTHVDEPVSICKVERAAADYGRKPVAGKKSHNIGKKIAIIGSGPCGLTAALDLIRTGYRVTVFEKTPIAGGTVRLALAPFKMPHDIVDEEIQYIKDVGVEIKTNTTIGKDISFEELRKDFDAILIAAGAYYGGYLHMHDREIRGVLNAATFMTRVNTRKKVEARGKKVVVIGGGYMAVDAARTAIRLEAGKVSVVFEHLRKGMASPEEELKASEEEGVHLHILTMPTKILSDRNNSVKGLECVKIEMKADKKGRKVPTPEKGNEFVIDADVIINALATTPDTTFLPENLNFELSRTGLLSADPKTLETSVEGVFIGGDYVKGARDIVSTIADGHKAALSIDAYLKKEEEAPKPPEVETYEIVLPEMLEDYEIISRRNMPIQDSEERTSNFREVEIGFSKDDAMLEAQRCLQCNNMWELIDEKCYQCGQCVEGCPTSCLSIADLGKEKKGSFFYEDLNLTEENIAPISIVLRKCIRCGVCADICPSDAIIFKSCEPKNIKVLAPAVA